MPSWMTDRLKEIAAVNKKAMYTVECQTALPFILVGRDGTPFTVFGFSRGCFFRSPFFTVLSVNDESSCVVLEVLAPCGCENHLFRTKARVIVNANRFCGIEIVDLPVYDYLQVAYVTKDQLCLPFKATNKDSPKTIWKIEQKGLQHVGTLSVRYIGTESKVELALYTKEKCITLQVPKGEFRSITIFNLQSIDIATPMDVVKGTIDIQLNCCDKKNIYF